MIFSDPAGQLQLIAHSRHPSVQENADREREMVFVALGGLRWGHGENIARTIGFVRTESRPKLVCRNSPGSGSVCNHKVPACVGAERKGGLKRGMARADKLSPEERSEIAKKAAKARWAD